MIKKSQISHDREVTITVSVKVGKKALEPAKLLVMESDLKKWKLSHRLPEIAVMGIIKFADKYLK